MTRRASAAWLAAFIVLATATSGCRGDRREHAEIGSRAARAWSSARRLESAGTVVALDVGMTRNGDAHVLLETMAPRHASTVQVADEGRAGWQITELGVRLAGASNQAMMAMMGNLLAVTWHQEGSGVHLATKWGRQPWDLPNDDEARVSAVVDAYRPQVAVSESGEILAVFGQKTSQGVGMALATRPPRSSAGLRPQAADDVLSPLVYFTNDGEVVSNARGEALVSWYQSTGEQLEVYVSERRTQAASFSRPEKGEQLSPASPRREGAGGRYLGFTSAALAESGEAIVVWTQPAAPGAYPVYMARREPSREWRRVTSIDDTFSRPDVDACCTQAAFTRNGELMVRWHERRNGRARVVLAIRSADGRWPHPGTAPLPLSDWRDEIGESALAFGTGGYVVAVWSERDGERWRVVSRRRSERDADWTGPETIAEPKATIARIPRVAVGGAANRTMVVWRMGDNAWYRTLGDAPSVRVP